MHQIQSTPNQDVTIDLWRVVQILWKRLWILIFAAVVVGTATLAYTSVFVVPTYRASFTAYVNNRLNTDGAGSTSTSDLNASIGLTYLYAEIVESRSVLVDAAELCGLNYSYSQLSQMVNTSSTENAALITVSVEAEDPALAAQLAEAISLTAPEHVARVVDGSSMRIVDSPVQPKSPYAPNTFQNTILGAIIGFAVTALIAIIVDLVYDRVQSSEDLETRYNLVVIGRIPDMEKAEKAYRSSSYYKQAAGE